MKASSNASLKSASYPQPQWQYFHYFNCAIVGAFGWSVATFCWNATAFYADSTMLLQFMIGWCICLCYFFGFFGVSFVHDIATLDHSSPHQVGNTSLSKSDPSLSQPTKAVPKSVPEPPCAPYKPGAPLSKEELRVKTKGMSNDEVAQLVLEGVMKDHELEKLLDCFRAVDVRRMVFEKKLNALGKHHALDLLPSQPSLDYGKVHGANCEIVVGYVPLPVGLVGPLKLNGQTVYVPMATTEGCLVASTNRGAKAITEGSGAVAEIVRDAITRAPCVRMASAQQAAQLKLWCEEPENFDKLKAAFESTTGFGKLLKCSPTVAGRNCYLRLQCFSGDAMGMNMVSKGSLAVIEALQAEFPSLQLVALSGNMCTDKKAAAINWIEGRGKSVVVEATIPKEVVRKTLKTTVPAMVETNLHKNLIGSAMAGTVGGFNCHASNIVTAVFLATGQDPAQNVESSNCITLLEETPEGDLWISCTMPSIEVGTVGGGTSLAAQSACLQAIGCKGGGATPGENAKKLATVVAATTMAGELSLLAALASNTLVAAHMQHNRKPVKP
jgi:hydroxymethylglutaryl-CoA reductase (NADPH)